MDDQAHQFPLWGSLLLYGVAVPVLVGLGLLFQDGLARLSGWKALRAAYPGPRSIPGSNELFAEMTSANPFSALTGSFMSWMIAGADETAFYVKPMWMLRPAFRPVRIPWSDIEVSRKKAVFGREMLVLTARRSPSASLAVSLALAQRLSRESRGAFRFKPPAAGGS